MTKIHYFYFSHPYIRNIFIRSNWRGYFWKFTDGLFHLELLPILLRGVVLRLALTIKCLMHSINPQNAHAASFWTWQKNTVSKKYHAVEKFALLCLSYSIKWSKRSCFSLPAAAAATHSQEQKDGRAPPPPSVTYAAVVLHWNVFLMFAATPIPLRDSGMTMMNREILLRIAAGRGAYPPCGGFATKIL